MSTTENLTNMLRDRLLELFDQVRTSRRRYYLNNPDKRPTRSEVPALIRRTARMNAAISGGLTLVPGPMGLVTILPELLVVVRNQVAMAYDIAVAYGKEDIVDRDLLLGVSLAGSGAGVLGFIQTDSTGSVVRRPTVRIAQKLAGVLARTLVKRLLRIFFGHWVPVVGAVAVAVATRRLTRQMGEEAVALFSKDIRFATDDGGDDIAMVDDSPAWVRMGLLIDLARTDGEVTADERALLHKFAQQLRVDSTRVDELLDSSERILVDVQRLQSTDRDQTIEDLVAVACSNETLSPAEEGFLFRVANAIDRADALQSALKNAA